MKKRLNTIVYAVAALLAVIAFLMLFAPAVSVDNGERSFKCLDIAFGKKEEIMGFEIQYFGFSFMYFLPFLLTAAGIALIAAACFGKGGKAVPAAAVICLVFAAILFFLPKQLFSLPSSYKEAAAQMGKNGGEQLKAVKKEMAASMKLGAGAILAGLCSLASAICVAADAFVIKPAK